MTFVGLLLRNLRYHRRGNLAVFLGVALGTAVLTGALLVGDSLRGSLRDRVVEQLGWVDQAMVTGRFFRAALADELAAKASPLLLLQGSAKSAEHRAGKIQLLGIDDRFWPAGQQPLGKEFWQSDKAEVVLNDTLAQRLKAKVGDEITIHVQKIENLPRESLLGKRKREDVLEPLTLTVIHILGKEPMARFNLKPSPEPAQNAFVPLRYLQETLDAPGQANAILLGPGPEALDKRLAEHVTLDDWNLKLRTPEDRARAFVKILDPRNATGGKLKKGRWHGRVPQELATVADGRGILTVEQIIAYYQKHRDYISVESRQLYLEPAVVAAVEKIAADGARFKAVPSLVYLADSIADGKNELPYAVVAGVEPSFLRFADKNHRPLGNDEIALARWDESPLHPGKGDLVALRFFAPDDHNNLKIDEELLRFRGFVPLEESLDDPDLAPEFPGITDKLDMRSWENLPFKYDRRRVKPRDETYWQRYRTTPKAYVTLETAQRLWSSRFGKLTSFHIYPGAEESARSLQASLLKELTPAQGGFVFQPVKQLGLKAGGGSTDFSVLFLAFSFFLIVSALLLVGLLVRLNLERRSSEMGVLMATGWNHRRVRMLLLGEGTILAVAGGIVGLAGALLYAQQMLAMLRRNWPGGENLAFLEVHAAPLSFVIGYAASLAASLLTILWATRVLGKLSPRALVAGETHEPAATAFAGRRWSRWIVGVAALGAVASFAAGLTVKGHEAQAGSFFGSGALLLTLALAALWGWLKAPRQSAPQQSLVALGVRNASRHPLRSLLTVGLLAAATFLITAVESFHKEASADFHHPEGGSGGFPFIAESDIPFYQDLNQPEVRADLKLPADLADVRFHPFRVQAGDDTSCLNLYEPLRPRLLAVPHRFAALGRFSFSDGLWETQAEKDNPWLLLEKPTGDNTIPAIVDANSAQWILKVGVGGTKEIEDDKGNKVTLRIVALLKESIFQSEILLAEADFLRVFPRQEGFRFFLVDGPPEKKAAIQSAVENALGDQGFNVIPAAERLQAYLAVENTYLATFQALGGLGLVLGALGLAIVLLRGVWERRGELALLRALGFAKSRLVWLVLAENLFLLLVGLGAGALAALLSVAPHLFGAGGHVLWLRLVALLGLVVGVGLSAGLAAVIGTLRTPLLAALRRE